MSRLNDLIHYFGVRPSRVLRKLAEEFEENEGYYRQFENVDEMIYAAYEKWVNHSDILRS